jgi:hypothetical protein
LRFGRTGAQECCFRQFPLRNKTSFGGVQRLLDVKLI